MLNRKMNSTDNKVISRVILMNKTKHTTLVFLSKDELLCKKLIYMAVKNY